MPRVVVHSDNTEGTVLFEEWVQPIHLDDPHQFQQFGERLLWALEDERREDAPLATATA